MFAGLLLPDGQMLAQAETIPAQSASCGWRRSICRRRFLFAEDWVLRAMCWSPTIPIAAAPMLDIVLLSPIFHEGEIAIASTIAHHIDIGMRGVAPRQLTAGRSSRRLIPPPLKLVEAGQPNRAIFDIIAANVRDPKASARSARPDRRLLHRRAPCPGAGAALRRRALRRALAGAVMDYAEIGVLPLAAIGQAAWKPVC